MKGEVHCTGFGWRLAGWDVIDGYYYRCCGCGILAAWDTIRSLKKKFVKSEQSAFPITHSSEGRK
jgi:hypothetical protein